MLYLKPSYRIIFQQSHAFMYTLLYYQPCFVYLYDPIEIMMDSDSTLTHGTGKSSPGFASLVPRVSWTQVPGLCNGTCSRYDLNSHTLQEFTK